MRRALETLPDPQRRVIEMRFGVDGDPEPKSVREVSRELGISASEVKQIENTRAGEPVGPAGAASAGRETTEPSISTRCRGNFASHAARERVKIGRPWSGPGAALRGGPTVRDGGVGRGAIGRRHRSAGVPYAVPLLPALPAHTSRAAHVRDGGHHLPALQAASSTSSPRPCSNSRSAAKRRRFERLESVGLEEPKPHLAPGGKRGDSVPKPLERHLADHGDRGGV